MTFDASVSYFVRSCLVKFVSRHPFPLGSTSHVVSFTTVILVVFTVTTASFGVSQVALDSGGARAGSAGIEGLGYWHWRC
ncbi:unnamed protein product [Closterium sp. NIES-54]